MKVLTHFNSIKVQLEPEKKQAIIHQLVFQFHKGTIRTLFELEYTKDDNNFNSIKVQLERLWRSYESCEYKFQFHKGTIRT